ncbi:TPA: hypothetical protein DIV45_01455 [Patescibacteria group bacterium]|nr:hypothetical protein [Patescibacteria group bacterium]
MREAGDDLLKLRDFFAEGGSNLRLESRKVLWDWLKPHALLAERGLNSDWWCILDEVGTYLRENRLNFDMRKAPCGALILAE